jgi:hypothetical protein
MRKVIRRAFLSSTFSLAAGRLYAQPKTEAQASLDLSTAVANSVGGFLPGDIMLAQQGKNPDQIATYPHLSITPIATFGSDYVLEPVAYGMKFANERAGGVFLQQDFTSPLQQTGVNATAYAALFAGGKVVVIILNKDAEQHIRADLNFGARRNSTVETRMLSAPALDSREARITKSQSSGQIERGEYSLTVPRAAGVCIA